MTSTLGIDLTKNISLFTVPAVFFTTCLAPHIYSIASAGGAYDNANPRGLRDGVGKDEQIDKPMKQRILRAKNASENGFETLGFFASAVVAGIQAGIEPAELNMLALSFFAARITYVGTYVYLGENRRLSFLRSGVWQVSMGIIVTIWVRAGLKMMQK